MKFKTLLISLAVIFGISWMATANQTAQPAGMGSPTTVAVVNMSTLFEKLKIVQDLEQIFGQEKNRIQQEAEQRKAKIQELQKELESGAFAKDSQDFRDRDEQVVKLSVEGDVWLKIQEKNLRAAHQKWFEEVYKRVTQSCSQLAQSGGVDVVLTDNPVDFNVPNSDSLIGQILQKKVIYASPRVDLTPQILEAIDATYQKDGGAGMIKLAK